jgi:predicted RND superfamily exporter protein
LFWENLLAATTTGMGFLILKTSPSVLIQNYGLIVAVSSVAVWILVHLVTIPLLGFFPNVEFRSWIHKPAYWSLWSLKNRKLVLIVSSFIFVFGFYSLTKINWNSKVLDDLPEHQNTRETTEYIDKNFGGTLEANFVIKTKEGWQKTGALKKLDSVIKKIKVQPAIGSVISVNDFYKSLSGPTQQRLPASNSELAEKNFMFSLSAENPIEKYVSGDNKNLLVQIRFKDKPSNIIQATKTNILKVIKKEFPDSSVSFFGFGTQYHAINQEISKDLVFSFWHALLAIGLLLAIVFKSWRWALMACLPNLIPPLVLLIWLNVNQIAIKPSVAIIFSIAIGLAFTNTVYIVGRILKLQRANKYKNYFPLKKALIEESNPCLLATTLVILGFSVFLFSYFGMNRVFGQYMILSVVAAMFGDLIFLPSFLQQFKRFFAALSIVILSFHASKSYAAVDAAEPLLKKAQSLLSSRDDSAQVSMQIIEANGSKKERQITIKRKYSDKKNQVLVKIQKPLEC